MSTVPNLDIARNSVVIYINPSVPEVSFYSAPSPLYPLVNSGVYQPPHVSPKSLLKSKPKLILSYTDYLILPLSFS